MSGLILYPITREEYIEVLKRRNMSGGMASAVEYKRRSSMQVAGSSPDLNQEQGPMSMADAY